MGEAKYERKPDWLRIRLEAGSDFQKVRGAIEGGRLHTVCEEARCPNLHECWGRHRTATFMILGDTCTRRCRFCAVKTGLPPPPDPDEPRRVAESAATLGLAHVVVTMVTRDDLPDGGAGLLAATVREIRLAAPKASIEVLSSDLMGKEESIATLVASRPDILSHNLETVRRLTPLVRSRSTYDRSLAFLAREAVLAPDLVVKSSLMLGLGETEDEILEAARDLLATGVRMINLGQYLQPSRLHAPVARWWTPAEFEGLKKAILDLGMAFVEAGPLVRSSYHAADQLADFRSASPRLAAKA
jgi:lipoic acid synthetase